MSAPSAVLQGFAYGEHLEKPHQRSLGFRLLVPSASEPWCAEVETLARRLQTAPYPDHWPQTDLLCSVLLADGRRVVAVARYGLTDHTSTHRRGGLELVGVVGPGSLGVPSALAVYRWLRQRRLATNDLHSLGGQHSLADVLAAVPPVPPPGDPVPVLPIRLWQDGALLFAATAPSDPDHRLGLLEQGADGTWQWLPLVGADFPLQSYAQRGPLVAWTPHLAGVAVKLDNKPGGQTNSQGRLRLVFALLMTLALLLLLANFLATLAFFRKPPALPPATAPAASAREPVATTPPVAPDPTADRYALALHRFLEKQGAIPELTHAQVDDQFDQLAQDKDLRLAGTEGKEVLVAAGLLARRSPGRVEEVIRKALEKKGYDAELINLACKRVHEQLTADTAPSP